MPNHEWEIRSKDWLFDQTNKKKTQFYSAVVTVKKHNLKLTTDQLENCEKKAG